MSQCWFSALCITISLNVKNLNFLAKFQKWIFGNFFKICNFDFVLFWLGIWRESLVWVGNHGAVGVSQNAGVLVVLVYPNIIYCVVVWGAASLKNMMSVLLLQKCVVRLITSSSFIAYSEPLLLSLQVLSVVDVYFFRLSIILFRYEKNQLPDCANSMFTKNCEIHGYCTRQAAWLQESGIRNSLFSTNNTLQ